MTELDIWTLHCIHTLLLLHVGEVLKRQRPHRRPPKSIRLHYSLQPGPAQRKAAEEMWKGRENRIWWEFQITHTRRRQGRERGEGESEETRACKKEQVFTVNINLGDVSSLFCTCLPFLCDLLLSAPAPGFAVRLKRQYFSSAPSCSLVRHGNDLSADWRCTLRDWICHKTSFYKTIRG